MGTGIQPLPGRQLDAVWLHGDKVDGDADGELLPRRQQVTADHGAVHLPRRVHQSSTAPRGVTLHTTNTTRYDTIRIRLAAWRSG